ncbi:phage tail protein [Dickeya zeae]|uniref:Phage tail protein n=1 Tax=Dickeya zeae TaxID=204042 RepID=A0AAE6YYI9_9GAMM|nr:phage tail protein [Dickeya zeae]QIZ50951.1 phage tail protein [Dickeya zeae]QYM90742.1 phage tail protein [Dickeya zeae]
MEKSNSPCSLDLILGKENLYKNSPINIGSITVGCTKCQDSQQDTPATQPTTTDGLKDLVGIPQPWPLADAPEGWLKCNGQAFDTAKYPQLAKLYPAGTLPDLRGEFIRGWDDGRNVDTGRSLLSWQKGTLTVSDPTLSSVNIGALIHSNNDAANTYLAMGFDKVDKKDYEMLRSAINVDSAGAQDLDNNGWANGYGSTRPRNIAFSYIVKAG